MGGRADVEYQYKIRDIGRPARLYVFSDGVYDITKPDGSIWGLSEFLAFSTQSFHSDRPNLDCLLKHTRTIAPKEVFEDDLTILEIIFK
jgi:sigma-B regulation protein RsbU (phosphoserine phosphatase)